MAAAHKRKKMPPRKRMKQKQKKQQQQQQQPQKKQKRRTGPKRRQGKNPSKEFMPMMLQDLCQGKAPLPAKANGKAVFSQRCVLTTQDGQQQCFLSNYMSSQASTGANVVPPAIVWPQRPVLSKWPVTLSPQPQSYLSNHMWQDRQQGCVLSNAMPSTTMGSRAGQQVGTLVAKDIQYEVNELVPRQMVPCLFASDPNISPY